jgi:hypothetical protein
MIKRIHNIFARPQPSFASERREYVARALLAKRSFPDLAGIEWGGLGYWLAVAYGDAQEVEVPSFALGQIYEPGLLRLIADPADFPEEQRSHMAKWDAGTLRETIAQTLPVYRDHMLHFISRKLPSGRFGSAPIERLAREANLDALFLAFACLRGCERDDEVTERAKALGLL